MIVIHMLFVTTSKRHTPDDDLSYAAAILAARLGDEPQITVRCAAKKQENMLWP